MILCLLLAGMHLQVAAAPDPAQLPKWGDVLLFSFFRDNGQDDLYLAWSRDALHWNEIKPPGKSFLTPTVAGKLMRDPSLLRAPDGTFHMVWTVGWKGDVIGYAHSRDLRQWSEQREIPVMTHEPGVRNSWAPELFYDAPSRKYFIFWSSTIPGRFPSTEKAGDDGYNHRVYYTTTRDFVSFAPTQLLFDGGFNVIDAFMIRDHGRYGLIVKDETLKPVKKDLRLTWSAKPEGPYSTAAEPFTSSWVEGPTAIQWQGQWRVYFDHYTNPQYYGVVTSRDLSHWTDMSSQLVFPKGARHGTVLRVPARVIRPLLDFSVR